MLVDQIEVTRIVFMDSLLPTDRPVLDLLRRSGELTVSDFQTELGVTATAVRQRLNRLLAGGYVCRFKSVDRSAGPGRPTHAYRLTDAGMRRTGANFADLAGVLWDEVRSISEPEVRRGLLNRISARLADVYRDRMSSAKPEGRMQQLAEIFAERQVPFEVVPSEDGELPVLTAVACPYPDLAEKDRSICAMEQLMLSDLVGERLALSKCRLDGDTCCTFQAGRSAAESSSEAVDRGNQ